MEDTSSHANLQKQIQDLHFQNNNLEKQIANSSEVINSTPTLAATTTSEPPAIAALSVADELADRESRKNNLIIYKLPESNNHSNDKTNVAKLCKTVFDIDVGITKSMRLGKKSEDKIRPLLICLDSQQNVVYIISYASYLRCHEEYNNVYIAPDMTKYQRHKHKQLVDELKRRRSNGENNLVIRNGEIITKRVYTNNARNHDTRAPHMETTNTDPPTMTPVAARMDDSPSHPSIIVNGSTKSS